MAEETSWEVSATVAVVILSTVCYMSVAKVGTPRGSGGNLSLIPTPGTKLGAQCVLDKLPENKWTRHYKWQDCSSLHSLAPVPWKVSEEDHVLFKGIKPKQPLEKNSLTS